MEKYTAKLINTNLINIPGMRYLLSRLEGPALQEANPYLLIKKGKTIRVSADLPSFFRWAEANGELERLYGKAFPISYSYYLYMKKEGRSTYMIDNQLAKLAKLWAEEATSGCELYNHNIAVS